MDKSLFQKELEFLEKCLQYNNITYRMCAFEDVKERLNKDDYQEKTIYYFVDEIYCHYTLFLLPGGSENELMIIGPYQDKTEKAASVVLLKKYMLAHRHQNWLLEFCETISLVQDLGMIETLLRAFAESIWGYENVVEKRLEGISLDSYEIELVPYKKEIKEEMDFYGESLLMKAVSNGQTAVAKIIFSNLRLYSFRGETEPLENLKRYSNNINLLFFESVKGMDLNKSEHLYTNIKQRIDNLVRSDDIFALWSEMIEKYCAIVNGHKAREYSPTIQRVIISANNDISAELKLNSIAEQLNMNASYLSNLFHKETGVTITSYVNGKKMEYAAFLLLNTEWNVSAIAQECGILDENYFARIFKKQYQMSPSQYRKQK